jgi:hypothetical protein
MAVITPDTFDPLRRYIGVRLQQGVPIVDADWNELEDIRKFELRAFLKWFVGNGTPSGNDGFRLEGTGLSNDFVIRAGAGVVPGGTSNNEVGLGFVGRCVVDGLDVIIAVDTNFSTQPLHTSRPGSAALAVALAVPQIQALATPVANGTLTAYLDVWERLTTPTEDPNLILPGLGTESCARLRREWVVRVRAGVGAPARGAPDYLARHSYYALASITRRNGDAVINPDDVSDQRERRLLLPPETLISDMLGVDPTDYRRGMGRPAISLREAINALLRGELPSTPDTPIAPAAAQDFMSYAFTIVGGDIVALWHSRRAANINQVFVTRWTMDTPLTAATNPPQQLTPGPLAHALPSTVVLPTGDLVVVYETAQQDIHFKRGTPTTLVAATQSDVATAAGVVKRQPFAVLAGDLVIFFWHQGQGAPNPHWQYRRWRHLDNTWIDNAPQQLSATNAASAAGGLGDFHAAVDGNGDVWVSFRADDTNNNFSIRLVRLRPAAAQVEEQTLSIGGANDHPFVLVDGSEAVWVFWRSGPDPTANIVYQRINLPPPAAIPGRPGTPAMTPLSQLAFRKPT